MQEVAELRASVSAAVGDGVVLDVCVVVAGVGDELAVFFEGAQRVDRPDFGEPAKHVEQVVVERPSTGVFDVLQPVFDFHYCFIKAGLKASSWAKFVIYNRRDGRGRG